MSILSSPYALVSELNKLKEEIEDLHVEINKLQGHLDDLELQLKSQSSLDYTALSNMMHKVNYEFYHL